VVSVILPTFNRLHFLKPAVDSVFAQTHTDWELIIADDGSAEDTRAYLRDLARRPRVRVLWLPHSGNPGAVRNAAMREAQGDYIAFLDSDDLWMPSKLELQVAALRDSPKYHWSYTRFNQINYAGQAINAERTSRWHFYEGQVFEALLALKAGIPTACVMVRAPVIEQLRGFDDHQGLHEDFDLWLRLAARHEVLVVKQLLVSVRYHDEHFSTHGIESLQARERVLSKIEALVASSAQRAAVRAARAYNAALLASVSAAGGRRVAAWRTLARSWRFSWHVPTWWVGIARVLAHSCLPVRLTDTIREYRRAARRAVPHG
jgi:glycosyltransferase involved in cell wall biosynthesis